MENTAKILPFNPPEIWHFGDPKVLANERKQKIEQSKKGRHLENLKLAS